jgi:hypothetical protein
MPRKCVASLHTALPSGPKKSTISQYFVTMNCTVCDELTNSGICLSCQQQPQRVAVVLANKIRLWERTYTNITKVCLADLYEGHDTVEVQSVTKSSFRIYFHAI